MRLPKQVQQLMRASYRIRALHRVEYCRLSTLLRLSVKAANIWTNIAASIVKLHIETTNLMTESQSALSCREIELPVNIDPRVNYHSSTFADCLMLDDAMMIEYSNY